MIVKWINRFGHTLFVTVLLLIRGTISNNWGLIVEVEPKKTLKLVVIVRNSLFAMSQVK